MDIINASGNGKIINDELKKEMDLPSNILPAASDLRTAQLKFACMREESACAHKLKMESGEDLYAEKVMNALIEKIEETAFQGNVSIDFHWKFSSELPRRFEERQELYIGTNIIYADGTFHVIADYLDAMSYLHALCEFLYDTLEAQGYKVEPTSMHRRPLASKPNPPELTREERIRLMFSESRGDADTFSFAVSWGSDDFKEALQQMESMSQYECYIAGVPLQDILA